MLHFWAPGKTQIRPFQFRERSQLFLRTHNETLSVVPMRIGKPDCSSLAIQSCHPAQTPSGLAEIVSDESPNTSLDYLDFHDGMNFPSCRAPRLMKSVS